MFGFLPTLAHQSSFSTFWTLPQAWDWEADRFHSFLPWSRMERRTKTSLEACCRRRVKDRLCEKNSAARPIGDQSPRRSLNQLIGARATLRLVLTAAGQELCVDFANDAIAPHERPCGLRGLSVDAGASFPRDPTWKRGLA
jgi:hypothetical protein